VKPGIHTMPAALYHADPCETPSLSNSLLTTLLQKTPRHAWLDHPKLNPAWTPRPAAQVFDLGTAAHSVLLEGVDAVTIVDADDWRTKEAKAARDKARAAGRIPMLPPQAAAVIDMMRAAHEFVAASGLAGVFERGKPEQTVIAKVNGAMVRCRIDWLTDDLVLDYKSTGAGGPGEWTRKNIVAHGYDTQSVLYPKALAAVGHKARRFLFLVQETEAPYLCYLVEPAGSLLELAESKINRGMRLWRECLQSDRWPGYSVAVHQAEAPVWAMKEEELHA
jgi:hypothetical protein